MRPVVDNGESAKKLRVTGSVIWLTGLPGAGKTTIANALAAALFQRGIPTLVLDGDDLRKGLCSDLGFSRQDRSENIRRAGEVAKFISTAGLVCIAAFVSPFRADRERVRAKLPPGAFVEVYVKASVEVCQQRDPKGLYQKARSNLIAQFTGVSDPYEPPLEPEVVLDTEIFSVSQSVTQLVSFLGARCDGPFKGLH